ncbi:MAG: lipopolysaccharide transport system ATP-binding protein [Solirubrobacteraceae bacterium]|nr:lipopolysaccharide transport system ATP-binding protein [Solirubrobacteraceae bacterium]
MPTLPDGTIEAAEVWKRFRADTRPSYLQDQLGRLGDRLRGRTTESWRWALRQIDLHAAPGESLALVGQNGSGKSTLLKILTRVMYPTAGRVSVGGRVGALIEVRAGISPQLTGRENIYLTGSLMGLPRREVRTRFDDIVEFAELEQAVDRQVKFYSTGMQMRLGFGVAAFLDPDVLLVDEVLAVGDATFQQRCLDRLRHVLQQGTTLVFVSHDLAAVEATCARAMWLHEGVIRSEGAVRDVLGDYRQSIEATAQQLAPVDGLLSIRDVEVRAASGGVVTTDEELIIQFVLGSEATYRTWVYVGVSEGPASPIFLLNPGRETGIDPGQTVVRCSIPRLPLPKGRYYVWVAVYRGWTGGAQLLDWQPVAQFDVHGPGLAEAPLAVVRLSPVHVDSSWDVTVR